MSGAKYIVKGYDPRFLMHDSSKSPLRDAIKILKGALKASIDNDANVKTSATTRVRAAKAPKK